MSNNSNGKQIYIGLFIFMLGGFAVGAARAQPQQPSYNRGLLSKLIEIKYTSELYLSSALKQGSNKDTALSNYNTLRWKLDGFVYQLSADMIAANSPRKMILLNAWCLEERNNEINKDNKTSKSSKKKIKVYINALNDIENFYQNQILPSLYKNNKTINLSTNVFYLLKDSYTIVNGISNMKTEKTMALIELLDHTRLLSPGELVKQGK
jgi:hypothetical protein